MIKEILIINVLPGIMDHLKGMLVDISKIKRIDDKLINEILIELLRIVDNLLKYVSEFVKKALQVPNSLETFDKALEESQCFFE